MPYIGIGVSLVNGTSVSDGPPPEAPAMTANDGVPMEDNSGNPMTEN